MAFSVPTLGEVSRMVENGFSTSFYGKSGNLRVGVLKVLSKVVAGAVYLPILFCQYLWKNSFIDSADADNLVRFGGWYNLPHKAASFSSGYVTIEGSGTIPAGTILQDSNGIEVETSASVTANDNRVSVKVYATNAGKEYSIDANSEMSFRDGDISGITYMVVDGDGINGGMAVDVVVGGVTEQWGETIDDYRNRLMYRRQHQPMGGAVSDYIQWATRFQYVTDCKVIPNFPKTNSVTIALSNFNSDDGIVSEEEAAEVKAYITDDARMPSTADVRVLQAFPLDFAFTIKLDKDSASIRSNIADALKTYLRTFNPGDVVTPDLIAKYINANDVASCSVTQMKVGYGGSWQVYESYELNYGEAIVQVPNINTISLDYV